MTHQTNTNNQGFTLIELLVVISIIGLLSSVVVGSLSSAKKKAEGAKIVQDMNQLKIALELYRNDHGKYPNEGVNAFKCNMCEEGYGAFLIRELVNNKYIPSVTEQYSVRTSYGPPAFYITTIASPLLDGGSFQYACGGRTLKSYYLQIYYEGDLNFDRAGFYFEGNYFPQDNIFRESNNWYCLGE